MKKVVDAGVSPSPREQNSAKATAVKAVLVLERIDRPLVGA